VLTKHICEEELPGTVGQTVSALALPKGDPRRQGHAYASASGATIDLSSDASQNVITFAYSDDASHAYVVHLWDEATGLPVAADIEFDSVEALLDYLAPEVPGYHVLFGGRGYLSARDGGQELTFWYERDPEPAQPAAPAARASYEPRHTAAVPSTGDATSPAAPAAAGAIGLGLVALGALLRRRRED
jgi:LPXTG-motif cell wall-anchored protein